MFDKPAKSNEKPILAQLSDHVNDSLNQVVFNSRLAFNSDKVAPPDITKKDAGGKYFDLNHADATDPTMSKYGAAAGLRAVAEITPEQAAAARVKDDKFNDLPWNKQYAA